jgi:predicted transcriptional regulator
MATATTIRLEPKAQAALQNLSKVTKRPMNKLVNEAVAAYVSQRSIAVERELEAMVEALRAHRESDPNDERAIAAFAKAEVAHPDPLEGRIVKPRRATGASREKVRARAHA